MKAVQKFSGSSNGTTISLLAVAMLSLLVSFTVQAEQSKVFGNYTVHYSVFTTDNLTPSVAKQYNIPRSKNRALLNVSVLKKTSDGSSKPSKAIIKGTTTNLNQQLRELELREISEKGAIYYIAEAHVDHAEILKYRLDVTPQGEKTTYTVSFQEQFYID